MNGTLVPLIELGVGFNPELTGRENVFLNSALLGFSRSETDEMYDEIVEFAELPDFMEEKLKNYSSGMQVRLAFSIAIRAKGDILLLDEVLAVGDESFQRKCYAYFDDLRRNNQTVVLVTHDMRAIERYCDRAILLSDGGIMAIGSAYEVSKKYSNLNAPKDTTKKATKSDQPETNQTIGVHARLVNNSTRKESSVFQYNQNVGVQLSWKDSDIKNVGVAIIRRDGEYVFGVNTFRSTEPIGKSKSINFNFNANLHEGDYFVKIGFFGVSEYEKIRFIEDGPKFSVTRDPEGLDWGGITKLTHEWSSEDV